MTRDLTEFITEHFQKALENNEIQPYYQPVIRTISRQLCSFEALARWIDPEIGMIYPDEFIPVLEMLDVIHLLDTAIIRQVCATIRRTMEEGNTPVPVSVNLSRLDFHLCDIFKTVDDIVTEYHIPHDFIYIEITESVMAEQKDMMLEIVDRFRYSGYQIWMDDFGSAYSSLNVLKDYTFNELKLDMGFLRPWNQKSQRIATSVIEMAKSIEIHTLAEGVETEEQFRYFRNIGCEKVQGYYFGKPMPYEEAIAHIRQNHIEIEAAHERRYYDDIGHVDMLSAVPFMTREERNSLKTARQLNSIPLVLLEIRKDSFSILFYNSAFEKIEKDARMFAVRFDQSILREAMPLNLISEKILNLTDSVRSGEEGRMHFTSHNDYYEITAKCFASTESKYTVLMRMTNLSKQSRFANTNHLDQYSRQLYSIYERITLLDLEADTITPLFIATRETLVSGTSDIRAMAREYADRLIFPADRDEYLDLVDPATMKERFDGTGTTHIIRLFRTSIRHGSFAWKSYTLVRAEENRYLLMIGNVSDVLKTFDHEKQIYQNTVFTPERLWNNLIDSNLLRIFWKDHDRRFLGATKAFLDYYGFKSLDDILGKNDEDLGWHLHPETYMNDELQVINEGITTHNIPGRCMNNGENKEILASKAPLYDESGAISGLIGYFIDRELLTVNDVRGTDTSRRDILTGLLNSRGIAEELAAFRDEYFLRGVDFVRVHISIDDFSALNEQYGFDYGDQVMSELGKALKDAFGRTCAVGRYAGQKFVLLHQVADHEEVRELRSEIKEIGRSIKEVNGIPVTLYLSVGYVMFSEFLDADEQAKKAEFRLMADHNGNASTESQMTKSSDIFHLFDNLPVIYVVYHVQGDDVVIFYVNHTFEQKSGTSSSDLVGRSVSELFPFLSEDWYENIRSAAFSTEPKEGRMVFDPTGIPYRYTASQIIYPGYCAVTYLEAPQSEESNSSTKTTAG